MIELDVTLNRPGFALAAQLSLPQGVTAIAGPSGAGKTSLMRIIAGLEPAARGVVRVAGQTLMEGRHSLPPEARGLGVVFQDSRLFPHLNTRENLLFGAADDRGLAPIAGLLDLSDLLNRRVGGLSGGEARRVALGRAVLSTPRLLLLDEPMTGLDRPRRMRIMAYIEALIDEAGLSVVLISHAWDEVLRLADHVVVLDQGRVRHQGRAQHVFADPSFAQSLGPGEARSLLAGPVVTLTEEMAAMALGPERLWLSRPKGAALGKTVKAAIMARDVTLALSRPENISTRSILPVRIERIDRGATVLVTCRVAGQALLAEITVSALEALHLRPGQPAFALIKATPFARGQE